MKRVLLLLALALVMAASAAPAVLARQSDFCLQYDVELGAYRCLPSKRACEQPQASDPTAPSECIKQNKIFR